MSHTAWSGPARALALGVDAAVTAARASDAAAFDEALAQLARVDAEQLAVVLGGVTRDLLERTHPDGLDVDDARAVAVSTVRASTWFPRLDGDAVLHALAGALGVADPDEAPGPPAAVVVAHGLLLVADLLTAAGETLPPVLDAALRELQRAQTVELP